MRLPESSRRGSLRERGRLSPVGSVRGLLTGSASGQPGSGTEWRSWPALGGRGSQCPCADLGDFTPPSHASLPLVPGTVASFLPPPPPACGKLLHMEFTQGVGFQIPSDRRGSPTSSPFTEPTAGRRLARQTRPTAGWACATVAGGVEPRPRRSGVRPPMTVLLVLC